MSEELERAMGRVEGKLDQVLGVINGHVEDDNNNFRELRSGLRAVEKKTYWLTGIIAAVAFLTGKLTGKY